MTSEEARVLHLLATWPSSRLDDAEALCAQAGVTGAEWSRIVWSLRAQELVDFDSLALTTEGGNVASMLAAAPPPAVQPEIPAAEAAPTAAPIDEPLGGGQVAEACPPFDSAMPGREVAALLRAEIARRGLKTSAVSGELFGGTGAICRMHGSDRPLRRKTAERVAAWLGMQYETPEKMPPASSGGAAAMPTAAAVDEGAASARVEPPGSIVDAAPSDLDNASGQDLADALRAAAKARGESVTDMLLPITRWPQTWLSQLEKARRPKTKTIERVRAILAGEMLPPRAERTACPQQLVRRVDREAAGLKPSGRELAEMDALRRQREAREAEAGAHDAAERAKTSRLPGETLAEAVRREALAAGQRRRAAGVAGGGSQQSLASVEADLEDDEGVGEVTAERRQRELRDVASPSALIRRATKEWPDKCRSVAGLAAQMGIAQGETWLRVIEAGILSIADDLAEEGGVFVPAPSTPTEGRG